MKVGKEIIGEVYKTYGLIEFASGVMCDIIEFVLVDLIKWL